MTPHPFHAEIAIEALEAGCHVLCEKPMAVHVGEADAMIAAAARAERLLAVSLQFRHRPEVIAAKRMLDEGRLGQIQRVDVLACLDPRRALLPSDAVAWHLEGRGRRRADEPGAA